ncbi:monovalent cation/H(+) antiporter subunit G [Nitratireductor sp.]|uniref:monovalent cation/H(+) antiporter subunit G n=1 Tax=Nitratireductor sp. TaxID=1872084 RepID=UPI0025E01CF3|nr:monovalent cation/H(+) antiporter subunit G [Nitratireductor sp.]
MDDVFNILTGILVIIGAAFTLIAAIGILRLPDLYTRMHAASKAGTLGSGLMLVALAIFAQDQAIVTRALAAVVFFLLTAPISAHLLAKAAYAAGYRLWGRSVHDDMASPERVASDGIDGKSNKED